MTIEIRFRDEAFADVAEAFSWYQDQRPGLGFEFKDDLAATIGVLSRMPETGPVVYRGLHRVLLRHFPYALYYDMGADVLSVRAVVHMHRDPSHWRRRA